MLKKILLNGVLCAALLSTPVIALENELFIYEMLHSKDNSAHAKVAAQSIHNKDIANLELADMVAQVLADSLAKNKKQTVDTQAWLLKALGASKSQRYQQLIQSIINSDADSKVKKYAKKALARLSESATNSFSAGDVNLTAIAKRVEQQQTNVKSKATRELFDKVYTGDTITSVIDTLGIPKRIDINFGTKRQWGITATYSMLSFKYGDFGNIVFYFQNGDIANWIVRKIDNSAPFSGELSKHPILGHNASVLRSYVREAMNQTSATQLDFDLAAERLYNGSDDDSFIDALAWTCKFLATSGSATYRQVLEHVIAQTDSRKLRKYATKSLRQLPSGDSKQYQKGDVFKTQ